MRCLAANETAVDLRILISMSVEAPEGWDELLQRKRKEYNELLPNERPRFGGRPEFINALEDRAKKQGSIHIDARLTRLKISYGNVERLARLVGDQSQQVQSNQLLELILDVTFAIFEVCQLQNPRSL